MYCNDALSFRTRWKRTVMCTDVHGRRLARVHGVRWLGRRGFYLFRANRSDMIDMELPALPNCHRNGVRSLLGIGGAVSFAIISARSVRVAPALR